MQTFERLEIEWAEWNGLDPAGMVCCNSGSAALHLSLEAMQLSPGSQVINPDFSMIAVPRAIVMAGLVPVFVDCGDDLNIDPDLFDNNWVPTDVKAVIAVHIYGRRCRMEDITRITRYNDDVPLIEDLAEAHGVRPHPDTDAATWSFYTNKIVAGAEGGAVWFKDPEHAKLARQLRCLGFTDAHDFNHVPRGHNYRLANCLAEKVLENLIPHGPEGNLWAHSLIKWRREREGWYDSLFPQEWRMPHRDAPWVYDVRIPGMTSETQTRIVRNLNVARIRARHAFKPMSRQEEFKMCSWYGKGREGFSLTQGWVGGESNADRLSREVIYLPLDLTVTKAECKTAVHIIQTVLSSP